MNEKKPIDIFGIAPYGEVLSKVVAKSIEGLETFLKAVCMPALDEVGLILKDKVRYWRLLNIVKILEKAKGKIDFDGKELQLKAHPRVALAIIENGSLNDNDEVQELWAGLFASSCTETGQDDENLIFVDLLKQLTVAEAKIIKYACENTKKILHKNNLVTGDLLIISCEQLIRISGVNDIHRLDRELDHLRALNLIGHSFSGGFNSLDDHLNADISPSALALNLYVRSQGSTKPMNIYWEKSIVKHETVEKENNKKLMKENPILKKVQDLKDRIEGDGL